MGFWIDMINVGEGDSFLLTLDNPAGPPWRVLIDAGTEGRAPDVVRHLQGTLNSGEVICLMIGTHLDRDHIGGFNALLDYYQPIGFVINTPGNLAQWLELRRTLGVFGTPESIRGIMDDLEVANQLVSKIDRLRIPRYIVDSTQPPIQLGTVSLSFLSPDPVGLVNAWADQVLADIKEQYLPPAGNIYGALYGGQPQPANQFIGNIIRAGRLSKWTDSRNDSSLVIELNYNGSPYALFTADASADVLRRVTPTKRYSFIKVSHHGSKTGLDNGLIAQWRPSRAAIPVGQNSYGHPDLEVLKALKGHGVMTFCSERTSSCRRACPGGTFGTVRFCQDKALPSNWTTIDPQRCANNNSSLRE